MKHTFLRIFLILTGIIATIWFILPKVIFDVLNIGNITGIAIGIILILLGLFLNILITFFHKIRNNKAGRFFTYILSACVLVPIVTAIILSCLMISSTHKKPTGNPAVIVLGCRVIGHNPSLVLGERLNAAYDYLMKHPDSVCIVSGGQGSDEVISEAQCMYDWLVACGIEKERILMEDRSTSTRENLSFSNKILTENDLGNEIAIVTNEFHMYRAHTIARKLGLSVASIPARTNFILFPTYVVREWYGILYEWLELNRH